MTYYNLIKVIQMPMDCFGAFIPAINEDVNHYLSILVARYELRFFFTRGDNYN